MDIIRQAFRLMEVITGFAGRVRKLYYAVVLLGHSCPKCGDRLIMIDEGQCQCRSCGHEFDPTIAFQQCSICSGKPVLRVRRYQCRQCGADVASRFFFDGLVFNKEYFRDKMTESRMRKKEQRECVRKMLADSRSGALIPPAAELSSVPGLVEALNGLTLGMDAPLPWRPEAGFDLKRYESHVQAYIRDFPVSLEEIPPLEKNARKDRIWRFIAIIFLAHFGLIDIWQDGQEIMVMKHETNREGQDISGDIETTGGVEGPLDRAEAW
jgi:rubredoxin